MEFINRTFKSCIKNINILNNKSKLYRLRLSPSNVNLMEAATKIIFNPPKDTSKNNLKKIYMDAVEWLPYLPTESLARTALLQLITGGLQYFSFIGENEDVYISQLLNYDRNLAKDFEEIAHLLKKDFGLILTIDETEAAEIEDIFYERIDSAHEFFMNERNEWITKFMGNLQDDISKESFATYIRQRIMSKLFLGRDTCYPVSPPPITKNWRKQREGLPHDFPMLEGIKGKKAEDFFHSTIYVYEQYSIEGVVEAKPGHIVVDAGAFLGDTAVYFSRKVGQFGKIYAFEISPATTEIGKKNMILNNCRNVEYINYALSDNIGTAFIQENEGGGSMNCISNIHSLNSQKIKITTLDKFRENHSPINFIKADIEGHEIAMLKGAQETIKNDKPVCAICIYHKKDDFWEIPDLLSSFRGDYKFWFRCEAEPVLFAK